MTMVTEDDLLSPPLGVLLAEDCLPACDSRNVEHGVDYVPHKSEASQHMGTQGSYVSIKARGRTIELRSMLELAVFSNFEFNPLVLDIREQYPLCRVELLKKRLEAGREIPRSEIRAIDFVVTLKKPDHKELLYHGVNVKHEVDKLTQEYGRQSGWEMARMRESGWSWSGLSEVKLLRRRLRAQMYARDLLRHANLDQCRQKVGLFASVLHALRPRSTLGRTMQAAAIEFGCPIAEAYALFAYALISGHCRIDWNAELDQNKPVVLLTRKIARPR